MGLLGTYIHAGLFSIGAAATCVAHGLPSTPDWIGYIPITSNTTANIVLLTRGSAAIVLSAAQAVQGEVFAIFAHSLIR